MVDTLRPGGALPLASRAVLRTLAPVFRRRTDHVYSTLQQVQRRITEQTGAPAPTPAQARPAVNPGTGSYPRPTEHFTPAGPTSANPATAALTRGSPAFPGLNQSTASNTITLSRPLAIVLSLLALGLAVLGFVVGHYTAPATQVNTGGFADGDPGTRPVRPAATNPRMILAVTSTKVMRGSEADRIKLAEVSRKWNLLLQTDPEFKALNLEGLFEVMKEPNGAMLVAYGWNGAWTGVERSDPKYQRLEARLNQRSQTVWMPVQP